MHGELLGDRVRLVLLPLLSRAQAVEGVAPLARLAVAAGLSRDRLWKLSRNLTVAAPPEAARIAVAAAPILGAEVAALRRLLESGDEDVVAWLRARAPQPRRCTHCGSRGGLGVPLIVGQAVHEACLPLLSDRAQLAWVDAVDRVIDGAPGVFARSFRAEQRGGGPVHLFGVSTRAGMEYRVFRRAWLLSRLPLRKVPRERPEPLSRKARLAWTAQVEQRLPAAPESLQHLWQRARETGVRLNLERLADFAQVPEYQFRKSWVAAGLPTPREVLQQLQGDR